MQLPPVIKAEVKFTTGTSLQLAGRELKALAVEGDSDVGLLAALFWNGNREWDGKWLLVDATGIRSRAGESYSATQEALRREARKQPGLDPLRHHVERSWPEFLAAFREAALAGHEVLVEDLARCHREGRTSEHLPKHEILGIEHLAAIEELVGRHGEAGTGRIMQDLLAYLLALAGYRTVTNNPVGVPDFTLTDPVKGPSLATPDRVLIELSQAEVERLIGLCEANGDLELEKKLSCLQNSAPGGVPLPRPRRERGPG